MPDIWFDFNSKKSINSNINVLIIKLGVRTGLCLYQLQIWKSVFADKNLKLIGKVYILRVSNVIKHVFFISRLEQRIV